MRPKTMVSSRDTQTRPEVVYDRPDGGLPAEGNPECRDAASKGKANDEENIEPVDVLVPIGTGNRKVGDVRLLRVGFGVVANWLRPARTRLGLREVLGINGLHAGGGLMRHGVWVGCKEEEWRGRCLE